jgi:hypothetical protein
MIELREELSVAGAEGAEGAESEEIPNAATYYVYPPVNDLLVPGALIKWPRQENGEVLHLDGEARQPTSDWWVVLTPSCDFAQNKVEYVLLAQGVPFDAWPPFADWRAQPSEKKWSKVEPVLRGKLPRYEFLPEFVEIPDLVVDLEQVLAIPHQDLANTSVIASLSSPYTEALLTKYSHFRGRIGTPDLDIPSLRQRLQGSL